MDPATGPSHGEGVTKLVNKNRAERGQDPEGNTNRSQFDDKDPDDQEGRMNLDHKGKEAEFEHLAGRVSSSPLIPSVG
jgi:hypothetical protein